MKSGRIPQPPKMVGGIPENMIFHIGWGPTGSLLSWLIACYKCKKRIVYDTSNILIIIVFGGYKPTNITGVAPSYRGYNHIFGFVEHCGGWDDAAESGSLILQH